MTKVKEAVKTSPAKPKSEVNILEKLSIEQSGRVFNKSASVDSKVQRFIDGNFTTPSIFKDDRFKKWAELCLRPSGVEISEPELKVAALEQMTKEKIKEQVAEKAANFDSLPLSDAQSAAVKAALTEYEEHLNEVVGKAIKMLAQVKKSIIQQKKVAKA